MKILKSKAIELIDEKITQLEYIRAKQINISDIEIYRREDDYLLAYYQTEVVLTELFSEEEMLKFRKHVTSPIWAAVNSRDSLIRYQAHMNHIQKCLVLLKAYRERIEVFWPANDEQGDTSSDMAISKTKALELIEKKIVQFKEVRDQANLDNVFDEAYSQAYYGTEHLLTNLFSEKEAQNFRRAVRSYFGLSDDPLS